MARLATAACLTVLLVVALGPVRAYLTEPREKLTSTPSAYTGATVPLPLPARGQACADEILFDTDARIARFGATAPAGTTAPPLEVIARGNREGPFRSDHESITQVAGGWTGTKQLDVRMRPPSRDVFGTLCVRNQSDRAMELVGSEDGRAYSRPTVRISGEPTDIELQLRLLEPGRSSFLSRVAAILTQASTLKPFGAGFLWLLIALGAVLAPLSIALAMRSALVLDAARTPMGARAPAFTLNRVSRRITTIPGWAIVAGASMLAVGWFLYWGLHTHVFQNDEDQYVYLSRLIQRDFPSSLWNFDIYGRGLQRLEVWLLAIPAWLADAPWSLAAGRFLNTIAFVSTAIPVYLIGRGMRLRPQWAALPAVLTVLVPWAVVTTAFLTENVAYPACLWAVWGMWRTAWEPSPWRDALALILLVVAGAARTGLMLLAPVLPVTVLLVGLRCGSGSAIARLRSLLRDHLLLWLAVGTAALPLLLGPLGVEPAQTLTQRLAGGYPTQVDADVWPVLKKMGEYFSRIVVGTGFLPAAVALPWLAAQIATPRGTRGFALASVFLLTAAALLYSLIPAGPDERYILYLAPLVLLSATIAVAHREISPLGLGITGVALALLLLQATWTAEQGPFGFFVVPVEMFYSRAVGLRLDRYLPGDDGDVLTLVAVALGLAGVVLAALLRWAPGRLAGWPAVLLVAAVALVIPIQTHYALAKYVNGAGSRSAPDLVERSFVDRMVPDGAQVASFLEGAGQRPEFFPIWQELQFYNQRIDRVFTLARNANPIPPGDVLVEGVGYDERTGLVTSPEPLPGYLAVPTPVGAVRLRGEIVHAPEYIAVALLRVSQPARLEWRAVGIESAGAVPRDGGAGVRFYGTDLEPSTYCATLGLAAPPDSGARWSLRRGTRDVRSGRLKPGARKAVSIPLPRLAEREFIDVSITGVAVQIQTIAVGTDC